MYNKFPKRTGIYHIRDNIEQLELKIYFRYVNSLLKLPKFDLKRPNTAADWNTCQTDKPLTAAPEDEQEVQQLRIKWQQKLMSESERALYREAVNCATEQQKKYHQWLLETEHLEKATKGKTKRRSGKKARQLDEAQEAVQRRTYAIFTYVHADHFAATELQEVAHTSSLQFAHEPAELMYIYAALQPATQLVALRWYAQQRMLHIYPDFNQLEENPYYIEIDTDYRHLYAYAVEHISQSRSGVSPHADSISNYLPLTAIMAAPTQWQAASELTTQFIMPPKRCRRIVLLCELRTAAQFEYDNLHVRYHVELPEHTVLEEGLLHGSTHSAAIRGAASGEAHFGHNWQLTLLCEECYNPAHLLHCYFELISVDSWERERVEGYAHYAVSLLAPGMDILALKCLLPTESFWQALNRYFIGGRQKFDFKSFFTPFSEAVESSQARFHSRYHCRMRSTGTLHFSCQRFTQRHAELLQPLRRACGMTLDDIMLAYREARRRLEAVVFK